MPEAPKPAAPPRTSPASLRAMLGGSGSCAGCSPPGPLAKHIIEENIPGPDVQSDDELLDYARGNGSTVYHPSCSGMMGNHGMSVADDQLRVHGFEALRIVDASVMPAVSSTNTNAPTIMIAEKGATIIKASAPGRGWRPDPLSP
jgi:choline dehydrogenase